MSDSPSVTLPALDAVAQAHSDKLRELLIERIRQSADPLSFAEYMAQALYEPGLGYYMAGAAKFGASGDFITAPEVTPLFGAAMGRQVHEVLEQTGGGVLELGAGSGRLAAGLLHAEDSGSQYPYYILEPSAELVLRQKALLSESLSEAQFSRLTWLDTLPSAFTGVILANEVMDALPVERFRIGSEVEQMVVSDTLEPSLIRANDELSAAVRAIENDLGRCLPVGYTSELCLLLKPWLAGLTASLARGAIILVDYGYPRREYYSEERSAGTLACYYRHRAHDDPFLHPGLQDITAHVDFTQVVESAVTLDMELLGYASQSAFLLDNELLTLAQQQQQRLNSETDRIELARAVKILTLPGEMGERFQVIALGKGYDLPLRGFRTQDLSYRL